MIGLMSSPPIGGIRLWIGRNMGLTIRSVHNLTGWYGSMK
jgi:hypothetical protein